MSLKAGFAKHLITPPVGIVMEGYGGRDAASPARAIHDDLWVRAVYLEQEGRRAAIISFDLLFFTDEQVSDLRRAVREATGLDDAEVLFGTTHTHSGPRLTLWSYIDPTPGYFATVVAGAKAAVSEAAADPVDVTLHAGMGETTLPVSRRKVDAQGIAQWLPDPDAPSCDALPVTVLRTVQAGAAGPAGSILALIFSASCHPSTTHAAEISADFPGVACRLLNERYGTTGAVFLQGCAGDSKPVVVAAPDRWRSGNWDDVEASGKLLAADVATVVDTGLTTYEPDLRVHLEDHAWPLASDFGREDYVRLAATATDRNQARWATDMLARLDRDGALPEHADIGLHAVQLAAGVRLLGLEGETVAELGAIMLDAYDRGVTFPLGYIDCCKLYLPVDHMLSEQGYEVDSFWEYGYPNGFKPGIDALVRRSLVDLQKRALVLNAEA